MARSLSGRNAYGSCVQSDEGLRSPYNGRTTALLTIVAHEPGNCRDSFARLEKRSKPYGWGFSRDVGSMQEEEEGEEEEDRYQRSDTCMRSKRI